MAAERWLQATKGLYHGASTSRLPFLEDQNEQNEERLED